MNEGYKNTFVVVCSVLLMVVVWGLLMLAIGSGLANSQ